MHHFDQLENMHKVQISLSQKRKFHKIVIKKTTFFTLANH